MEELKKDLTALFDDVQAAAVKLDIDQKQIKLSELENKTQKPDYWQVTDNQVAQDESKQLADLTAFVHPWQNLRTELSDALELIELGDDAVQKELETTLSKAHTQYEALRSDLRFSGEHDSANVILNIQAGAGGNDAQDWAEMLMKMYVRWAEKHEVAATILSESAGEEAGIKSVSMRLSGRFVYGQLKGEHGVHRLVRLSPFNSANSRETSFAMIEVIPEIDSPDAIEIDPADVRVDVYRAGGRGGQSVNTTDSAVRLTHEPTGVVVSIQNERSQLQNKETAFKVLRSRLAQLAQEQHLETVKDLKGPNQEAAWGNQIRSYVLHPYTMVKDSRSNFSTANVEDVLNGDLDELIDAYLDATLGE